MFNGKFFEVISHECAVGIATCADNEPHIVGTWNSYLTIRGDRILIPAASMKQTEANVVKNPKVKVNVATRDMQGLYGPGCGFLITGTAKFIDSGEEFEELKKKFYFMTRVLEITATEVRQIL